MAAKSSGQSTWLVLGILAMGLTQHVHGFDNVAMVINLLLLGGNIGRDGAGLCPVRGHSNVQGQRTVGISEKPELVPLDKLAAMYDFEPPRDKGLNTVEACEGMPQLPKVAIWSWIICEIICWRGPPSSAGMT